MKQFRQLGSRVWAFIRSRQRLLLQISLVLFLLFITIFSPPLPHQSAEAEKPVPAVIPAYRDFHLLIPKINIEAPVIPDVNGQNKTEYFHALEGGVAHFRGTAKPGEGSNIFIFGHSSFYPDQPGNYKEIFKDLEEMSAGDEIIVWFNQKEFKYRVSETKVVEPDDVSVLKSTPTEQLTLMTCYPPGTTQKRLIVVATPQ